MESICRNISLAAIALAVVAAAPAARAGLAPAEQAAVFKAAGFKKARGGQYMRCREDPPTASYLPGSIELEDLDGDGRPEAWVKESSISCYGNTAEAFVLLTRDDGGWRVLLDAVGVPVVRKAKHGGWPDIEVGGPGFGKFPVYRWDGKAYGARR
ncbi:MAG: hypothetical protein JNK80_02780 [Dechloromonas sp.]|nr:hypothetical protein [Dechloromonas sp.]